MGRREGRETDQFIDQRDEREEVFFDGEVEGVAVFEVHGDCDTSSLA